MLNTQLSFDVPSTLNTKSETPGPTVINGLCEPHVIKSSSTALGRACERKARFLLGEYGYDCIDVGEGFEFDLIATGRGASYRVQIKVIGKNGTTALGRTSQKVGGAVHKPYGKDAFDVLFLIDRDSFSGYCIPASEIIKGDSMRSNVRASNYPAYFIHY